MSSLLRIFYITKYQTITVKITFTLVPVAALILVVNHIHNQMKSLKNPRYTDIFSEGNNLY